MKIQLYINRHTGAASPPAAIIIIANLFLLEPDGNSGETKLKFEITSHHCFCHELGFMPNPEVLIKDMGGFLHALTKRIVAITFPDLCNLRHRPKMLRNAKKDLCSTAGHLFLCQFAYCSRDWLVKAACIPNLAAAKWRAHTSAAPCTTQ